MTATINFSHLDTELKPKVRVALAKLRSKCIACSVPLDWQIFANQPSHDAMSNQQFRSAVREAAGPGAQISWAGDIA